MRYRYIREGSWVYYWFLGNRFLGTWKVALMFILTGLRLGITGKAVLCLPQEEEVNGK